MRIILFVAIIISIFSGCKTDSKFPITPEPKPTLTVTEKDSMLHNLVGAIRLINEIDDTLSTISQEIKTPKISESSGSIISYQDGIRTKLFSVTEKLRQYKSDIKSLAVVNKKYAAFISALQKTIDLREKQIQDLQLQVHELKKRLNEKEEELNSTLRTLQAEIADKQRIKFNLTKEITDLNNEYDDLKYTAYYVYGSEDELEKKGLVKYEGGIFLFGLGKTLVPSAFENNAEFMKVDIRDAVELSFPSEIKRIISPQNQKYCEIQGNRLRITETQKFWQGSKYLFVITK